MGVQSRQLGNMGVGGLEAVEFFDGACICIFYSLCYLQKLDYGLNI